MSLKSALADTKALLEANGFQKQVSRYDYSILDQVRPRAVIIRQGDIAWGPDTYGNYLRVMEVSLDCFVYYEIAKISESHDKLEALIDEIDDIFINNIYLGKTDDDYNRAILRSATRADVLNRAVPSGSHEWLGCVISVLVEEIISEAGSAQ